MSRQRLRPSRAIGLVCTLAIPVAATAKEPSVTWRLSVSGKIVSYVPGQGIESCEAHSGGTASVGGTVGIGVSFDGEGHTLDISPKKLDNELLVETRVSVGDARGERVEHDISDLKPLVIDLGQDADGRQYQANLIPSVTKVEVRIDPFTSVADKLAMFSFRSSPVLLNDSEYVGRFGGTGVVASFDVSGVTSVKFCLHEIPGWKPWGVLDDGVLSIVNPDDHTTLEIAGVQNGSSNGAVTLPGGPYRVWVDWKPSQSDVDASFEVLKQVRRRIIDQEIPGGVHALALIDKRLAQGPKPWIDSCGFRSRYASEKPADSK